MGNVQLSNDFRLLDSEQVANPSEDPYFARAAEFDRFLQGQMNEEEDGKYRKGCRRAPTENVFCFSVLNREYFTEKADKEKQHQGHHRKKITRLYPKIRKGEVKNWTALRKASVRSTLTAVAKLTPKSLAKLEKLALKETKCPLNIGISIASAYEDLLPSKAKLEQVATMYERAGMCIKRNPADRVTMLTRAALFYIGDKKYKKARTALEEAVKQNNTFLARAQYWLHRVYRELGQTKAANEVLDQLQGRYPFSFHTLVALTGMNQDPGEVLEKRSLHQLTRSQQMPLINPLIEQVEILNRLGFEDSAKTILDWAVIESQGIEPEVKVYLADLKKQAKDYFAKISLLSDVLYNNPRLVSKSTMELYFPKVFFPIFERQSKIIDPYLLLSIARRESAFNVKAVSSANARGLMQLLPAVRNQLKKENNLFDADDNVEVGAHYILKLLSRLDGQIHYALAAYNAGPSRLKVWLERYPVTDAILFIDMIPYRETREYVASILRNYYWYRRIHQEGKVLPPRRFLELAITR